MADAQCLRQFIERDDGRVPTPAFETTEILLTETRPRLDFLLSQGFLPTQAGKVSADQFTHVHAFEDRDLHTLRLSTIVCKDIALRGVLRLARLAPLA